MPKKELKVGDKVRIVNVMNCLFGYNYTMKELTGKTTVITKKAECPDHEETAEYRLKIDESKYYWSANCLELIEHNRFIENE